MTIPPAGRGVPDAAAVQLRKTLKAAAAHYEATKGTLVTRIEKLIEAVTSQRRSVTLSITFGRSATSVPITPTNCWTRTPRSARCASRRPCCGICSRSPPSWQGCKRKPRRRPLTTRTTPGDAATRAEVTSAAGDVGGAEPHRPQLIPTSARTSPGRPSPGRLCRRAPERSLPRPWGSEEPGHRANASTTCEAGRGLRGVRRSTMGAPRPVCGTPRLYSARGRRPRANDSHPLPHQVAKGLGSW